MNCDYITIDTCDTCEQHGTGAMLHCNGTPVLFQCRTCQPASYEALARVQVAAWLDGGTAMPGYVVTRENVERFSEAFAA